MLENSQKHIHKKAEVNKLALKMLNKMLSLIQQGKAPGYPVPTLLVWLYFPKKRRRMGTGVFSFKMSKFKVYKNPMDKWIHSVKFNLICFYTLLQAIFCLRFFVRLFLDISKITQDKKKLEQEKTQANYRALQAKRNGRSWLHSWAFKMQLYFHLISSGEKHFMFYVIHLRTSSCVRIYTDLLASAGNFYVVENGFIGVRRSDLEIMFIWKTIKFGGFYVLR